MKSQCICMCPTCGKGMIMMNLSQHRKHGLLQQLQTGFGEADSENAICQNWEYTCGPQSHACFCGKTPSGGEPALQAVEGKFGKAQSVSGGGKFKLLIANQGAKIFGLLDNRKHKLLHASSDFDPFSFMVSIGQCRTNMAVAGATHGEENG